MTDTCPHCGTEYLYDEERGTDYCESCGITKPEVERDKLTDWQRRAIPRLQHAAGVYLDAGDEEGSQACLDLAAEIEEE